MIPQLILAILIGILAGTLTGLIPGIHINLVSVIIIGFFHAVSLSPNPLLLVIFIVSMATAHTFLDFIPSIYLGAPDEDTALSILPGHKYLLRGNAHRAVVLTLIGSTAAIILLSIVIPLFFFIVPIIITTIEQMMSWILIWISIFLIYDNKNKTAAFLIFALAGFLGISSLNINVTEPLLPLLTGLFGTSTIIHSLQSKTSLPKQTIEKFNLNKKELIKPLAITTIISPICSFLPGIGSSQAAIIGSKITGKLSKDQFLILLGSINTLVITTSFFTLYLIGKSRTGAASAISNLLTIQPSNLALISIAIITSALIAIPLTLAVSKNIAKNIHKIHYSKLSTLILLLLTAMTTIISGPLGILVLMVATSLGLLCTTLGVRKSILMGCLLIPTILYYWPI